MKIIVRLFLGAVLVSITGCAMPRGNVSGTAGYTGGTIEGYSQSAGHGESANSAVEDYRKVMSDPGPF